MSALSTTKYIILHYLQYLWYLHFWIIYNIYLSSRTRTLRTLAPGPRPASTDPPWTSSKRWKLRYDIIENIRRINFIKQLLINFMTFWSIFWIIYDQTMLICRESLWRARERCPRGWTCRRYPHSALIPTPPESEQHQHKNITTIRKTINYFCILI